MEAMMKKAQNRESTEWQHLSLGEVFKPNRPRVSPSEKPELPFIGMEHVEAHTMKLLGTVPAGTMKSSSVHFQPGDVLYGRLRPYLNKVYRPDFEGLCSAEFIVFPNTPDVDTKYLQYFLNSYDFVSFATQLNEGDRPRVDFKQIAPYLFPLAPLPEQRRIVSAIELQLGRLDAAVARLHAAKAKLKRYKQAVLKAAVEGPLLEGDYEWITIEEASERIVDCLHSTPKFTENGKYCIDTTCIEQGVIRFDKARFVTEDSYTDRIRRLKPEAGDILFAREGTVGTTVVVPEDVDLCLGQRMMMFRLKKTVLPEFFMYVMQSPIMVDKYRPLIMGTTAPHLNIRDIKKFTLPKYPLSLQESIVDKLERELEVIRETESTLDAQLVQAGRLRQAVLKRAFEGRLV